MSRWVGGWVVCTSGMHRGDVWAAEKGGHRRSWGVQVQGAEEVA